MKLGDDKRYLHWGITAFCVLAGGILLMWILLNWSGVSNTVNVLLNALSSVFVGLILAFFLSAFVNFSEKLFLERLSKKIFPRNPKRAFAFKRSLSICLSIAIELAAVFGFCMLVLPGIYNSIVSLVSKMSSYIRVGQELIDRLFSDYPEIESIVLNVYTETVAYLSDWIKNDLLATVEVVLVNISNGIVEIINILAGFFIGNVVSVYLLYSKERFVAQLNKLVCCIFKPKAVNFIMDNARFAYRTFGSYILGKLATSVLLGFLCAIFMSITNMPYVALICVLVAITNLIPYVGPYIGGGLGALLIVLENPVQCLVFIVFICVAQMFEGNILSPKIIGATIGLTGFWVIVAMLIGGAVGGLMGMIIGVPIFAVFYSILKNIAENHLRKKQLPENTDEFRNMKKLDTKNNKIIYK